jgi:tellurite resistance protein TehA-like permease
VITGLAVTFWGPATGLIPLLAAGTAVRYLRRPVRIRYRPDLWTVVFPLGMYATAGPQLGTAAMLPLIHHIGEKYISWYEVVLMVSRPGFRR